jgi:hypothetical protein
MKSLLIFLHWLMAFVAVVSIDTEQSPLWAVAACFAWVAIATYLLVKYASPTDALRMLVRWRRAWRSLFRPKFDFEAFNRRLERELEDKRRPMRAKYIENYYRCLRYANNPGSDFKWLETPQTCIDFIKKDVHQAVLNSLVKAMDCTLKI